ncbi:MAG TPA: penicillin-binding protein activator [Candidatus Macondimonas sp.]|nr:penicillin-binding protein activator [Candidatus Macondimonas sp.]
MIHPALLRAMLPLRACSPAAAAVLLWCCAPHLWAQPQPPASVPQPPVPTDPAATDLRIERGLAAAQAALERGQAPAAEAELRLLETVPGTPSQQARYALLVAETLIASGRPHEARRWLARSTEALPPAWRARHAVALRQASETAHHPASPAIAVATKAPGSPSVAALLPSSGRWAGVAAAIQDGMLRAYLETPPEQRARLSFPRIDESPDSAVAATQQALAGQARGIIGPLDKTMIDRVAARISPDVPMLALNHIDRSRPGLFQFALAPEDEARIVARQTLELGHRNAWVIIPADEWGDRHLAAFKDPFLANGGRIRNITRYDPKRTDFQDVLRAGVQRSGEADMVFLAAAPLQAGALRPQLRFLGAGMLPIYATSAINTDALDAVVRDLEGISFPDLPWVIDSAAAPRGAPPAMRLQAFGIDAYRLWRKIQRDGAPQGVQLTGATGVLRSDADGRLHRTGLPWAHIAQGEIKAGLARNASGEALLQP